MATTAPPPNAWTPRLYRAFQGRDGRLLLALIILLICEPLITQGPAWSILTAAVWNAVLVSALFSANGRRTPHLFGLGVAAADFLIHPLAAYGVAPRLIHVHSFLVFVTMLYATVWSLGDILQAPKVTTRTLQKAVCVYILLGMVWLHLYLLIDAGRPGSFLLPNGRTNPSVSYAERREQTMELMYFSFVTLSTVGYGDITPVRSVARTFSALEGVAGQIYLTVLIARLVGLQIAHSLSEPA